MAGIRLKAMKRRRWQPEADLDLATRTFWNFPCTAELGGKKPCKLLQLRWVENGIFLASVSRLMTVLQPNETSRGPSPTTSETQPGLKREFERNLQVLESARNGLRASTIRILRLDRRMGTWVGCKISPSVLGVVEMVGRCFRSQGQARTEGRILKQRRYS